MNKHFFHSGLILFYLLIFFSPNKPIYFSAYIVSTFFFYFGSKNLRLSLLYSLILSLFSDIGIAGSLFLVEPSELSQGAGWQFMPMTILILPLLFLSYREKIKKLHLSDYLPILFLFCSFFSFLFFPYSNVLFGLISLVEIVLIYFLLRIYINKENLKDISILLISMLIFQTIIGLIQFLLKHPIGTLVDTDIISRPFGYTVSEEESLYRISGTFIHPNFFASFLLVATPFLIFAKNKNLILKVFTFLSVIVLFFTYSRAAWIFFVVIFLITNINSIKNYLKSFRQVIIGGVMGLLLLVIFSPYLFSRLDTFSQAFTEKGSFGTRWKLYQEAGNIINQYPLTGVGLNQSLSEYTSSPVTDLFDYVKPSVFYRIHNSFLEIAAEVGLPAMIIFILFLVMVFWSYFKNKDKTIYQKMAFYGFVGLFG
ncbi:O-antigen ligase family protein, partial [Candidatus Roizmanbacteria bacterium]|nr:O-antigen ligase family protein [Candidatus Roizmanbacteria bacterium]